MATTDDAQLYANAYFAVAAFESPSTSSVYSMLSEQGHIWNDERFTAAESTFYQSQAYAAFIAKLREPSASSGQRGRADISHLRADVWNKTNGTCWYCGKQMNPFVDFTIDHVQPLAKGGTDDLDNLVPCCVTCNTSKGAR